MTLLEHPDAASLPDRFRRWFAQRGWTPRAHQLALLDRARAGRSTLLIAPTGGGKTLAGFLPTLVDLSLLPPPLWRRSPAAGGREGGRREVFRLVDNDPPPGTAQTATPPNPTGGVGLHPAIPACPHTHKNTPQNAHPRDNPRNLETPVAEMRLPIRIETRTGDTPVSRRTRQRRDPPDILLTTPEQLALLLASADAPFLFGSLQRVILDELHSLVLSKRGDLLSLDLARLFALAPGLQTIGLSATVAEPDDLRRFLVPQRGVVPARADLVVAEAGAAPHVTMLPPGEYLPWAGHTARHAYAAIYDLIGKHRTTLVFVNTRSQAEMIFRELWDLNEDGLAIALHHGSLEVGQRRKVEDAMAKGKLRAVVCTSSLDLGIDWGDVDLVVNVGAPKGSSRLLQRIGRANHRLDEPSRGILVPANRFEVLECSAAIEAVAQNAQDTPPLRTGALDVLAQHVLGTACAAPFDANELYDEVRSAAPYAGLARADFDAVLDFVATGGYALKAYERYAKIRKDAQGQWRVTHPRFAQQYR
ncbi:MAG: helicase-related protein, partial [Pseudorhodoplanes sp.]